MRCTLAATQTARQIVDLVLAEWKSSRVCMNKLVLNLLFCEQTDHTGEMVCLL